MSVTPSALPGLSTNSTWASNSWEYRYTSSTSSHHIYEIHHIASGSIVNNSGIKVGKFGETDYNIWSDADVNDHPNVVTERLDGTVLLSSSTYPELYIFTKPTTASWMTTGGGGGGSSSSTTSKKVFCNFW
jgi:hypothetical protein